MYQFTTTERNNEKASEYETKAMLYLFGCRQDSRDMDVFIIDCFNDVSGANRDVNRLHKNYKEDVPVEIRIYVDQIQIINFAGSDHYIDMEKFAAGKVRARRYRNPKIGEFFKEIDLSEKKSTGISKILRELKRNGSPLPEFETDADRTYMITTIKIHSGFGFENENFSQKMTEV